VASIAPRESKIRPDHAPESPQQIGSMISPLPPSPARPPAPTLFLAFAPAVVSAPDELVLGFAVVWVWCGCQATRLPACLPACLHGRTSRHNQHSTAAFLVSSVSDSLVSTQQPTRPTPLLPLSIVPLSYDLVAFT